MKIDEKVDLADLISKAEKSVVNVKDARLREIAFEKTLDFLLGSNKNPKDSTDNPKEIKKTKTTSPNSSSKKSGPKDWIRELIEEDFFKQPKSSNDILSELQSRSHILKASDITWPLEALCHEKLLRRRKMKPENGGKEVLHWHNW